MIDVMKEIEPVGKLYQEKNYKKGLVLLKELWEKIPEPKESEKNGFSIIDCGVIISLKANDLDLAWEWAQKGLIYSGNINLGGESEILIGEVAYAKSDMETAKKYFKIVKQLSGTRLFQGKDPNYLKIIK